VSRFLEAVDPGWGQYFDIECEITGLDSPFQKIQIFETRLFGRVLVLDGVVQTTERDEYIYHEMLTHLPLLSHAAPKRLLIIGGGDGGCLREVLRHPVDKAVLVEIDEAVITACRLHMPGVSGEAFDDPRAHIEVADGVDYLRDTDERFDIILIDSSDPGGPNTPLFDAEFYRSCAARLTSGGLIAAQQGVVFTQPDSFRRGYQALASAVAAAAPYRVHVPSYSGGPLMITMGCQSSDILTPPADTLAARLEKRGIEPRHYTPALHLASFVLPGETAALLHR